jgi:hypothetical protein
LARINFSVSNLDEHQKTSELTFILHPSHLYQVDTSAEAYHNSISIFS